MNRLIYAASEHDADMLYATRFLAPDAFLYFEKRGRSHVVLNSLEYDRGRRQAAVDRVHNQSELLADLRKKTTKSLSTSLWIGEVLRQQHLKQVDVGPNFPVGLADGLRKSGIKVKIAEGGIFPERAIKSRSEIGALRKSLKVTADLIAHAIGLIRASRKGPGGKLVLGGVALTSERVQAEVRIEAARRGFDASHPIVAGGVQACDPHERGHGPLKANELIILDIFPRNLAGGYWGDMTRTVVKGRASDSQRRLFETVRAGQKLAFSQLKAGVDGLKVHRSIEGLFVQRGYVTGQSGGRYEGFFHGTGHGVGLEIHESPRVSSVSQAMRSGHVVTVEPGLYYAKIGGARIEDVVWIRPGKCELLSHFPNQLEI